MASLSFARFLVTELAKSNSNSKIRSNRGGKLIFYRLSALVKTAQYCCWRSDDKVDMMVMMMMMMVMMMMMTPVSGEWQGWDLKGAYIASNKQSDRPGNTLFLFINHFHKISSNFFFFKNHFYYVFFSLSVELKYRYNDIFSKFGPLHQTNNCIFFSLPEFHDVSTNKESF